MSAETVEPVCPDCGCRRVVLGAHPPVQPVDNSKAWCWVCRVTRPSADFLPAR